MRNWLEVIGWSVLAVGVAFGVAFFFGFGVISFYLIHWRH